MLRTLHVTAAFSESFDYAILCFPLRTRRYAGSDPLPINDKGLFVISHDSFRFYRGREATWTSPCGALSFLLLTIAESDFVIVTNLSEYLQYIYLLNILRMNDCALQAIHNLESSSQIIEDLPKPPDGGFGFFMKEKGKEKIYEDFKSFAKASIQKDLDILCPIQQAIEKVSGKRLISFKDFSKYHKSVEDSIDVAYQDLAHLDQFMDKSCLPNCRPLSERNDLTVYRGVTGFFFSEVPSILRNRQNVQNESDHYREFKQAFPAEFKNKNFVETLTQMQHFDLPTRLLDITLNPLVALFMACTDEYSRKEMSFFPGEVIAYFPQFDSSKGENQMKFADSTRVLVLSAIPLLEEEEKENLRVLLKRFEKSPEDHDVITNYLRTGEPKKLPSEAQEIVNELRPSPFDCYSKLQRIVHSERPEFDFSCFDPFDLLHCYYVQVGMINERITAQSGAFIIFGLDQGYLETKFSSTRNHLQAPRLFITNKPGILRELEQLNISKKTMIPDMDHVAHFIAEKH